MDIINELAAQTTLTALRRPLDQSEVVNLYSYELRKELEGRKKTISDEYTEINAKLESSSCKTDALTNKFAKAEIDSLVKLLPGRFPKKYTVSGDSKFLYGENLKVLSGSVRCSMLNDSEDPNKFISLLEIVVKSTPEINQAVQDHNSIHSDANVRRYAISEETLKLNKRLAYIQDEVSEFSALITKAPSLTDNDLIQRIAQFVK